MLSSKSFLTRIRPALLIGALAASGCANDAGPAHDMRDAPDLSPLCSASSHASPDCQEAWQISDGPNLPVALDHHGTVVVTTDADSFLYVVGGNSYHGVFDTVYKAQIGADGSLGTWGKTTALPYRVAGQAIFVAHGRIFVAGGQNNGAFYDTVESAPVHADGTLGSWRAEPKLPAARFHAYAASTADAVYITGGVDEHFVATDTIYRAAINADGTLGDFTTEATKLPVPRSHHAALVHDGYLFIAGGLTGNPTAINHGLPEVLSAAISTDGSLGPLSAVGSLSPPPITPSAFELDGMMYVVGGIDDDGNYLSEIKSAAFSGAGALAAFAPVLPGLPTGRSHVHQTPVFQRSFFSVGGSVDLEVTTPKVAIGRFEWTTKDALKAMSQTLGADRLPRSSGPRKPHCAMKP